MNLSTCRRIVLLSALSSFAVGAFGILYRLPNHVIGELLSYAQISVFGLLPFLFISMLARKEGERNRTIAAGVILISVIGAIVYLEDMVFSHEPSWGFSFFMAPAIQFLGFLALWASVALTSRSSGTPQKRGAP